MMDRRAFLRGAAFIAAGAITADQIATLERLTWQRTLFPGAAVGGWQLWTMDVTSDGTVLWQQSAGYRTEAHAVASSLPRMDGRARVGYVTVGPPTDLSRTWTPAL